jgi:hypothetical protein
MDKPTKFLTHDRALKDGFVLHAKDEEVLRVTEATATSPLPKEMADVLEHGGFLPPPGIQEHASSTALYFAIMLQCMRSVVAHDPDVVAWAREARLQKRFSWRMIAQAFSDEYSAPWDPPWHQIGGIALCQAVAEKDGEDYLQPPWN